MPRNLNRRVEVLFPVSAPRLIARVRDEILATYLADDASARHMGRDGSYTPKSAIEGLDSHAWFLGDRISRPSPIGSMAEAQTVTPMDAADIEPPRLLRSACVLVKRPNRVETEGVNRDDDALVTAATEQVATEDVGNVAMSIMVARLASDLAGHFVNVAEEICKHTIDSNPRPIPGHDPGTRSGNNEVEQRRSMVSEQQDTDSPTITPRGTFDLDRDPAYATETHPGFATG
jgi:hypothetical protein